MTAKHTQPQHFGDVLIDGELVANGPVNLGTFGDKFFVDPVNGNDGNAGDSKNDAFKTLQKAIDKTKENRSDLIIVAPGAHNVTSTVNFNKQGITVIAADMGMPAPVGGEQSMVNAAASFTNGPAATITKPCRIIGLGFASRDLTKENLLIDSGGSGGFEGGFISLRYCRFPCWYGAIDAGVRMKGGSLNHVRRCSFDGLFVGFGTGAIVMENSGAIAPANSRIKRNYFSGVGTGKHAIVHAVGSVPVGQLYMSNTMEGGFTGNIGKFLDNNNVASSGMIADNYLGGMATKAAAFENMTNSNLKFSDNHYEE